MTLEEYDALPAGAQHNVRAYFRLTDGQAHRAIQRHRDGHVTLSDGERQVLVDALAAVPPGLLS